MGAKAITWIAAVGLLSAGCSVVATSADVVTTRVKEQVQECVERRRNEEWAEAAWARVAGGQPTRFSEDHRCGFLTGFEEQVYRGAVCRGSDRKRHLDSRGGFNYSLPDFP